MGKALASAVVPLALLASACTDSIAPGAVGRSLTSGTPSQTITLTENMWATGPGFGLNFGDVQLCKTTPAGSPAATFGFSVTVNGIFPPVGLITTLSPSLSVAAGGGTTCSVIYSRTGGNTELGQLVIVENAPPTDWALTSINTLQLVSGLASGLPSGGTSDVENVGTRTATVYINGEMARRVVFTNTYTPPTPPPICDFITFGRLVVEVGGNKVVISGNAGGNKPGGGILGEFHIEVNGVDNHVSDIATYGPIASGPLSGLTNSRITTGIAKNGNSVELRLWDGGEPGKGTDRVYVKINGVEVLGAVGPFIDQGNMQYHAECRGPN